ncbi:MAG: ABC transporter permease subunit [Chloroflexi bacterium]|nr:MAG: ABC transporter permease subunit [Chloroflexota bacterium]
MAAVRRGVQGTRRLKLQVFRIIVFVAAGLFFLVPIGAMVEFSTRGVGDQPRTLAAWQSIGTYPDLVAAITASLELAAITTIAMLVLLVPTMVWVRLKLPRLNPIIEFICLLPLTIPAIVLVVGLFPIYNWMGTNFSDSILTLSIAYVVLVLPYDYRSLEAGLAAIDVKTLTEAARSLGAGWFTVMWRIIVPNISSAILNSAFLSVALVLGEYTIANNLLYNNLQVEIAMLGRANAGVSIAVAVASLLFAFGVLVLLSFFNRGRGRLQLVELQQVMRTERG